MELLDSQVGQKMWKLLSKCNVLRFWLTEKSIFELMANLKFSISESGPGSVHIALKPLKVFKLLRVHWKCSKSHFALKFSRKEFLKWPSNLNRLGYAAEIFGIFYSQWDYQMVNVSRILKFQAWRGFDEFGWNDRKSLILVLH